MNRKDTKIATSYQMEVFNGRIRIYCKAWCTCHSAIIGVGRSLQNAVSDWKAQIGRLHYVAKGEIEKLP